jgi:hypothetical protein
MMTIDSPSAIMTNAWIRSAAWAPSMLHSRGVWAIERRVAHPRVFTGDAANPNRAETTSSLFKQPLRQSPGVDEDTDAVRPKPLTRRNATVNSWEQ